ncbi:MAG TPA: PHP domain-containing protein [Candidatus Saccharimonadales bacterium]|nr:PHP domain-containing protein [Candidatus Saccharimonadales bacterium]
MSTYKVDLHTHSQASKDGALTEADYERALTNGQLDTIAITDHNTAEFALDLRRTLGERIIVGEEIATLEGEIIGLFLTETIPPFLSARETVKRIKAQKGLVYVPHPFETVRKGITAEALEGIAESVDIIEVHNGRAVFQNRSELAREWSVQHEVPGAASSDGHGPRGWGRTYSVVTAMPTRQNLVTLLHQATYEAHWPGVLGVLYPKLNRLRKKFAHG